MANYFPGDGHTPADFTVYLIVPSRNYRTRLGGYRTLADAKKAIARNEEGRKDTFGGLLSPNRDAVAYEVWKSKGWERADIE